MAAAAAPAGKYPDRGPRILLTGYAMVEKTVEAMKIGATDLLEKPADLEALAAIIKQAKADKMLVVEKQTEEKIKDNLHRFSG